MKELESRAKRKALEQQAKYKQVNMDDKTQEWMVEFIQKLPEVDKDKARATVVNEIIEKLVTTKIPRVSNLRIE